MTKLSKARKRAKASIKTAKRLLKKHGGQIAPEHNQEIEDALAPLKAATRAKTKTPSTRPSKPSTKRLSGGVGHLRKSPTREYIESIGTAVLIALFLRAFFVEASSFRAGR